ncbi:MAG TPA: IS110 family transposase [Candidatus Paceibacterota bacterium]|nr:IS110 family transposase [Candidatus Paceibacterota bacterium]
MQVVYARCAGLDVHKKTLSACVSVCEAGGAKQQQMRVFGTFTSDLLALADWLTEHGVTHVAMEATGVYWRPVWAVLEGQFQQMLVNPQHIKAVPGRKTDAKDCEWIADLLQHGLLKGSFVPPTPIQDLRDLTRYRAELRQSQNRVANRIQKFLEQANLKLSSVASNTLGVSGRQMLEAIIAGQDNPEQLAKLARGKLKNKIPQLEQALEGRVRDHHRFLLAEYLDEWEALGQRIARLEIEIDKQIRPFEQAVALWQTIPGVDHVTACNLVAEIGVDMNQFPTDQHLASWAALCPGNHESAGKRKSGRTRDGNKWLRRSLCQAAWAVTRKKNCYLSAQFNRLAARRGVKRAVMAVAHTMLIIGYHMLKTGRGYYELGGDYLERINHDQLQRYYVKRLQRLGLKVTVEPVREAA